MAAYVYVGNVDPTDGTSRIIVSFDRHLILDGPKVELSDSEYEALSHRYNLKPADEVVADPSESEPQLVESAPRAPKRQRGVSVVEETQENPEADPQTANPNSAPLPTGGSAGPGTSATGISSGGDGPATR